MIQLEKQAQEIIWQLHISVQTWLCPSIVVKFQVVFSVAELQYMEDVGNRSRLALYLL